MSPLLAPLLAQVVGLQLGDRTEGRYVNYNGGERFEGSTAPVVGLNVTVRRTSVQAVYTPGITVAPLETTPRQLFVFHQVGLSASHALRQTTFRVNSSFGIGSLNLKLYGVQGLQPGTSLGGALPGVPTVGTPTTGTPTTDAPTTGSPTTGGATGTPTPGGALTAPVEDQRVRFYVLTNSLDISHRVTKFLQIGGVAGSSIADGRDEDSRRFYSSLRGWTLGGNVNYTYPVSKADNVAAVGSLMKTWSSSNNEAATLNATLTYNHRFARRTTGFGGAGVNVTRFTQANGLAGFSIFPTANVGGAHEVPVGRGGLAFSFSVFSSPVLDPLRALVDPRVGLTGVVTYTHKKFFASTSGTVALSIASGDSNVGGVNAATAEARAGYLVGKYTALDTGARVSRQTYGGATVLPTTWAAYLGFNVGYEAILFRGH